MRMLVLVALSVLTISHPVEGQDDEVNRKSLEGLEAVAVWIVNQAREAERYGLTASAIQSDVELRLRTAGIRVLSMKENLATTGAPFLLVHLNVVQMQASSDPPVSIYAYSLSVGLVQRVRLERNTELRVPAARTWGVDYVGVVGDQRVQTVRDVIRDATNRFVNTYLSVNTVNQRR